MRTNFATLDMIAERRDTTMDLRLRKNETKSAPTKHNPKEAPTVLNAPHNDSGEQRRTGRGRYRKR